MEEKDDRIRVLKSSLSLPLIRGLLTLIFFVLHACFALRRSFRLLCGLFCDVFSP